MYNEAHAQPYASVKGEDIDEQNTADRRIRKQYSNNGLSIKSKSGGSSNTAAQGAS
jgi:hypothetical protein